MFVEKTFLDSSKLPKWIKQKLNTVPVGYQMA